MIWGKQNEKEGKELVTKSLKLDKEDNISIFIIVIYHNFSSSNNFKVNIFYLFLKEGSVLPYFVNNPFHT